MNQDKETTPTPEPVQDSSSQRDQIVDIEVLLDTDVFAFLKSECDKLKVSLDAYISAVLETYVESVKQIEEK